jgi:hypothetical protein
VIGAPATASGGKDAAGAVYSYKRLAKGGLPVLVEKISGAAAMDRLGTAIASAPIDGNDPVADVLALAPNATGVTTRPNSGVAYVRIAH